MKESNQPPIPKDFATKLGEYFSRRADAHPTPDEPVEKFIGRTESGAYGVGALTPRQVAEEVVNQTPWGVEYTRFYLQISDNLGDSTGDRVISDLNSMLADN